MNSVKLRTEEPKMEEKDPKKTKEESNTGPETSVGEFLRNTSWLDSNPEQELRVIRSFGKIRGKPL